ncbi:Isonitrile hydratase [Metarhizium anisopliae]|nr:Isonitrile hydratase [Metarhizium anisopliae]
MSWNTEWAKDNDQVKLQSYRILTVDKNTTDNNLPTKYALLLFNGFQALDVFGPIDILNTLSINYTLELSILSTDLNPVSTKIEGVFSVGQSIVPTHTLEDAPDDIEVLLVPGGRGSLNTERTQVDIDFIKSTFPKLRYFLTVCTGSILAARAGVLDSKNATSNKLNFDFAITQGPRVNWIRHARWVNDGNIWTSSGVSAGIDMMYAYVTELYGENVAAYIAKDMEYVRNTDASNDPFCNGPSRLNGGCAAYH